MTAAVIGSTVLLSVGPFAKTALIVRCVTQGRTKRLETRQPILHLSINGYQSAAISGEGTTANFTHRPLGPFLQVAFSVSFYVSMFRS